MTLANGLIWLTGHCTAATLPLQSPLTALISWQYCSPHPSPPTFPTYVLLVSFDHELLSTLEHFSTFSSSNKLILQVLT